MLRFACRNGALVALLILISCAPMECSVSVTNSSSSSISQSTMSWSWSASYTISTSSSLSHSATFKTFHNTSRTSQQTASMTSSFTMGSNTTSPDKLVTSSVVTSPTATLFSRTTFTRVPTHTQTPIPTAENTNSASPSSPPSFTRSTSNDASLSPSPSSTPSPTLSNSPNPASISQTRSASRDLTLSYKSASDEGTASSSRNITPSGSMPSLTRTAVCTATPSDARSASVSASRLESPTRKSSSVDTSLSRSATASAANISMTLRKSLSLNISSSYSIGNTTVTNSTTAEHTLTIRFTSMTITASRLRSGSVSEASSATKTFTATLSLTDERSLSISSSGHEGSRSITSTDSVLFVTNTITGTESFNQTLTRTADSPTTSFSSEVTRSRSSSDVVFEMFHMAADLEVATTAAAVVSFGIVLVGGMAPTVRTDASVLTLLMQVTPCQSTDRVLTQVEMFTNRDQSGGRSVYGLSPFWDFGLLIACYANIAVLVVFFWLYSGLVLLAAERAQMLEVELAVQQSYGTKSEADIDDEQEAAKLKRKGIFREWRRSTIEVAEQWRFPAIPLRVAEMLLPGTTFCAVGYLLTAPENASGLPAGAAIAVVIAVLLGFVGYLHVRIVPCLKYVPVHHPLLIPDAVSPFRSRLWVARLIPTYRWEPHRLRAGFGIMYDSMSKPYVRYRALDIALALSYSGMSALGTFGTGLSCVIGCGWMTLSMILAGLMTATHSLYRLPLDRFWVPCKHAVFAVMCCLKTTGINVPSALYFVQFAMMLIRLVYGVWVRYEEHRITEIEKAIAQPSLSLREEEWGSMISSDDVSDLDGRSTIMTVIMKEMSPPLDASASVIVAAPAPTPPTRAPPQPTRIFEEEDEKDAELWNIL